MDIYNSDQRDYFKKNSSEHEMLHGSSKPFSGTFWAAGSFKRLGFVTIVVGIFFLFARFTSTLFASVMVAIGLIVSLLGIFIENKYKSEVKEIFKDNPK